MQVDICHQVRNDFSPITGNINANDKFDNKDVEHAEVSHLDKLQARQFVFGIPFNSNSCIVACLQQVRIYCACQKQIAPIHECEY